MKAKEHTQRERTKKVTSIGAHPTRSMPKNKHKRRCWKRYRGQGRK
tara:strand:- start:222 stop:359 length:138 start_codon:yes stop_codon:yes gene_type:complete